VANKPQKINDIFQEARKRFIEWMNEKPTGNFSLKITVNQGGIRGNPKIGVEDEV